MGKPRTRLYFREYKVMFLPLKERELQKVQTSNDDDDAGSYDKPNLDCIIEASLVDDLGANSAVLERILGFFRPWHYRRAHDYPLGHSKDLRAVQMAGSQNKSKT